MNGKKVLLGLFLLCVISCTKKQSTNVEEGNIYLDIFNEYWNIYDKYYPLFERKNVNWDSVKSRFEMAAAQSSTEQELKNILDTIMQVYIQDGHSSFTTPIGEVNYEPTISHMEFLEADEEIISNMSLVDVRGGEGNAYLTYGFLKNHDSIGYLLSKRFEPVSEEEKELRDFRSLVDSALSNLKSAKGIIIDVRLNGGGQGHFAQYLASRFLDVDELPWKRSRVKVGKGGPLGEWLTQEYSGIRDERAEGGTVGSDDVELNVISKAGDFQFSKSVVVLTSRFTASAAEYFTSIMRNLEHTIVMGDTTFGIFAGSEHMTLRANSEWKTRISVHDVEMYVKGEEPAYQSFEGIGIPPDSVVLVESDEGITSIRDIQIEAAALVLNQGVE